MTGPLVGSDASKRFSWTTSCPTARLFVELAVSLVVVVVVRVTLSLTHKELCVT